MTTSKDQYQEVIDLLKDIKALHNSKSHVEEHEFLRNLIREKQANAEMMQALKVRIVSTSLWGFISAIAFAVAFTVKHWINGPM